MVRYCLIGLFRVKAYALFMMHLWVLFLSLSAFSQSTRPYLISGFDDVLRQAENTGLIKAGLKIFEPDKTFSGMPELYQVLTRHELENEKFALVSAISTMFDSRISKLLTEHNYPQHQRYLRSWLTEWSIEGFKLSKIQKIMNDKPNRQFIIIFDNSQASIKMVNIFNEKLNKRLSEIYLREVVDQEPIKGAILFTNAFDIALNEFRKGFLSREDVAKVGLSIVTEKEKQNLYPDYALCPRDYNPCLDVPEEIKEICVRVEAHTKSLCQ